MMGVSVVKGTPLRTPLSPAHLSTALVHGLLDYDQLLGHL